MTTIDPTEEAALIARYKAGDRRAGEALLRMHQGIIHKSAKTYFGYGIDDDLLQEARIGFLRAVELFDASRGASLCTYGAQRARSEAYKYFCANDGAIELPGNVRLALKRAAQRGMAANEIASTTWRSARRAADAAAYNFRPMSINAARFSDGDTGLDDLLADTAPSPEELLTAGDQTQRRLNRIERLMGSLKPGYAQVIRLRMLGGEARTTASIAAELGITRQAVQQREAKALEQLRGAMRRDTLR